MFMQPRSSLRESQKRKLDPRIGFGMTCKMIDLIEETGGVGTELSGPRLHEVIQQWRETFSSSVLDDMGKWTIEGIEWHTFSYGYHPYKTGEIAKEQFQNHGFENMYLWSSSPNFSDSAFLVRP